MFVNNIDPVILNIGALQIRYYGIIFALGFIICYTFLRHFMKKGKVGCLDNKRLDDLIFYLLLGVVVGARVLNFVFYNPSVFWTDPLEILRIWHGGLSFHGGLIGATIALYIFSKRYKISKYQLMDALVIPAILGLALGRIANFTNSELFGPVTNVPWCVQFLRIDTLCRHPYQLYASLSHFILFGILLLVYFKQKKVGSTFWTFIGGYGLFRVFTDIWRFEDKLFLGVLSTGQVLSLIMFLAAVSYFIYSKTKAHQ